MKKELQTKKDNDALISDGRNIQRNRDVLVECASAIFKGANIPNNLLKDVDNQIDNFNGGRDTRKKERAKTFVEMLNHFGFDTRMQLFESVENGGMAVETANRFIEEYDCQTASMKAMAQVAANAFVRILENSRIMRDCSSLKRVDQLQINFYSMIGKELDRATRQFDTAIGNLVRMKSPPLKVNVTAQTAFVAHNQEFNAHNRP